MDDQIKEVVTVTVNGADVAAMAAAFGAGAEFGFLVLFPVGLMVWAVSVIITAIKSGGENGR